MRFALRTLLILVLVLPPALALGYRAWNRHQIRQKLMRELESERPYRK